MKRWILSIMLLAALSMALVGCGGQSSSGGSTALTILTGSEQGTYYPLGGALASIINDEVENMSATAVTSGASVANINDVNDNKAELALVQNDVAFYAVEGTQFFDQKTEGFSAVATLYPEVVQIVVLADSGIENVDDLRGKRVAVGDQGSGAEVNARQILEAHGITYDDIRVEYMKFGTATEGIQDGNIDAGFITAGTPTAAVEQLKVSKKIRLISLDPQAIDKLTTDYPYYTPFTVEKDLYGMDEDAQTLAVQAMLIASNSMSEEDVYQITKAMFEHVDEFAKAHQRSGSYITLDSAQEGLSVPLHPGAKRFYDEVK
ncbi:TAXI family TRAP transporter solute-binding subunit [Rubeoparvulum massiliense]|uniref:TAXI family TRAP transporter solute-binding subunit n=1 Tax=Rubeoparvulum massiliense TaxID=1631346 RepID=UPI00065E1D50|nr:TAXI family TRAP transporter solute-binding subunit [Rubeoparvulum massiliense]